MGKANLFPDFRELFAALNRKKVRYLVVGGYAVNFYGYHRYTKDIDVWIATDRANSELLSKVLQEWGGFAASKVRPSQFQEPGKAFTMGVEPVRVDILTGPSGVRFDDCYARRTDVEVDGVKVPLISLADLKVNKRASGRLKDLADLENLPSKQARVRKKRRKTSG
jgi:predicted nucleotidyltransferase